MLKCVYFDDLYVLKERTCKPSIVRGPWATPCERVTLSLTCCPPRETQAGRLRDITIPRILFDGSHRVWLSVPNRHPGLHQGKGRDLRCADDHIRGRISAVSALPAPGINPLKCD